MDLDEANIVLSNSFSTYDESNFNLESITDFEDFMEELFYWTSGSVKRKTDFSLDTSSYFLESSDSVNFVTYKETINEILKNHLYTYLYKHFILMDIKTLD
jgi:hypothetical protein